MGAFYSVPMALLAGMYLAEVLSLDADGWKTLTWTVGILVLPMFVAGSTTQRRGARQLLDWMDEDAPSHEATLDALGAARTLPLRSASLGYATWLVGGTLVAIVALVLIDGFGGAEFASTVVCSAGAGLVSTLFSYSSTKRLVRPIAIELARIAGRDANARTARPIPLRWKMQLAFLATSVVPLVMVFLLVWTGEGNGGESRAAFVGWVALIAGTFSLILGSAFGREVSETASELVDALGNVASGDLRQLTGVESDDELGLVGRASDALIVNLQTAVEQMTASAQGLDDAAAELDSVSNAVIAASASQSEATAAAAEAVAGIEQAVGGMNARAQELVHSAQESSSAIVELGATGEELRDTAGVLTERAEAAVPALEEIAASGQRIRSSVATLSAAASEASASTEQLAAAAKEADRRAEEAGRLAASVATTSQEGQEAVHSVDRGMASIAEAVSGSADALRDLQQRVSQIDSVVAVIDEVAADTHLLSLNAAIIAAQAGENGRAFTVVASEVKELAQRVSDRTQEIGAIIKAVEHGSSETARSMARTRTLVDEGVALTQTAGGALEEIHGAARTSGEHLGAILHSIAEQGEAAQHIRDVVARFVEQLRQIEEDIGTQSDSQTSMIDVVARVREAAVAVHRSIEEQARGNTTLRDELVAVEEATRGIGESLGSQAEDCQRSRDQVDEVRESARRNQTECDRLSSAVSGLREQALHLRSQVERFEIAD